MGDGHVIRGKHLNSVTNGAIGLVLWFLICLSPLWAPVRILLWTRDFLACIDSALCPTYCVSFILSYLKLIFSYNILLTR